jgi:hypothetical protein
LAAASERPCEALLRFCLATLGILYERTSRIQELRKEEGLRIDFNVGNFFWHDKIAGTGLTFLTPAFPSL